MPENKYDFTLTMPLSWLGILEEALGKFIRRRAQDDYEVTDEAKLLLLLEQSGEAVRLKDEQVRLEEQIKDLEKRRNELRT